MVPSISFNVDLIAARLSGLEETIIARFLDRAQFCENKVAYEKGKSGFEGGGDASLFELRLRYQEEMDAVFGRFCVPEERPFYRDLPPPRRKVHLPDYGLGVTDYNTVNLMPQIVEAYLAAIPSFCVAGDDGQYGSSVEHDVMVLQAISRRVHFGAYFVAEAKYRKDAALYRPLIETGDREGILALLSRPEVEQRILARVREKAEWLQSKVDRRIRKVVDPEFILSFYRDVIIPLTKEGQVRYLLARGSSEAGRT